MSLSATLASAIMASLSKTASSADESVSLLQELFRIDTTNAPHQPGKRDGGGEVGREEERWSFSS